MPPDGPAETRRRHPHRLHNLARIHYRSSPLAPPIPTCRSHPASPESLRIFERHSRPARARHRRHVPAPARRRKLRLRQHCRRPQNLAVAPRTRHVGIVEYQPPRRGRSRHRRRQQHLSRARRPFAERTHRRPSPRHARRHQGSPQLPARWRISHQGPPLARHRRHHPRSRRPAPARNQCGRRARSPRRLRWTRRSAPQRDQFRPILHRYRWAPLRPRPRESRPARSHRHFPHRHRKRSAG